MKNIIKKGRNLKEIVRFKCIVCDCIFETDECELAFEYMALGLISTCPHCSKTVFQANSLSKEDK